MPSAADTRSFLIEPYHELTDFGSSPALGLTPSSPAPSYHQRQPSTSSLQEFLIPRKPISSSSSNEYFRTDHITTRRTNTGTTSAIVVDAAKQSYRETWRRAQLFLTRSGPAHHYLRTGSGASTEVARFTGWRYGVLCACIGVSVCLLAEVIFVITVLAVDRPVYGIGTLYEGSCNKVRNLTIWILIPFNFVGTVLIASSNYVMQCLNAPTRKDIDDAHSNGHYSNIGISSIQNLTYLAGWKKALWWMLGLSTVPIHLLLNSVVFASLQANDYGVMLVDTTFLTDADWNKTCGGLTSNTLASTFVCGFREQILDKSLNYSTLTNEDCIRRYANNLQSTSSNLVMLAETGSSKWANLPQSNDLKNGTYLSGDVSDGFATFDRPPLAEVGKYTKYWPGADVTGNNLFLASDDPLFNISSFYAVWNALSYRYWAITDEINYDFDDPATLLATQWEPTTWLCNTAYTASGASCSQSAALSNVTDWRVTPSKIQINSCYSVDTKETCTLQYSLTIILVVMGCDMLKLFAMYMTLRKALQIQPKSYHDPIATLGDAIESFLETPDPTSAGRCLMDQAAIRALDIKHFSHIEHYGDMPLERRIQKLPDLFGPTPLPWQPHKRRLLNVPSRSRWVLFLLLYAGLVGATIAILYIALRDLEAVGLSDIWTQGVGTINPNSVFSSSTFAADTESGLLTSVVLINLPQLLFSFWYYIYNGMFTCMMSGVEWGKFANRDRPRTLRVTAPRGQQRSTYWLSLPWKFSLPLLCVSAAMHWLVSRSLFLVKIDVYGHGGLLEPKRNVSACGFSALAIVLVMMLVCMMLVTMMLIGLKRVPAGIPLVGTCSWAISGACHDVDGEEDAAMKPLLWGVTDKSEGDVMDGVSKPGHCSITSREVDGSVPGYIYS